MIRRRHRPPPTSTAEPELLDYVVTIQSDLVVTRRQVVHLANVLNHILPHIVNALADQANQTAAQTVTLTGIAASPNRIGRAVTSPPTSDPPAALNLPPVIQRKQVPEPVRPDRRCQTPPDPFPPAATMTG